MSLTTRHGIALPLYTEDDERLYLPYRWAATILALLAGACCLCYAFAMTMMFDGGTLREAHIVRTVHQLPWVDSQAGATRAPHPSYLVDALVTYEGRAIPLQSSVDAQAHRSGHFTLYLRHHAGRPLEISPNPLPTEYPHKTAGLRALFIGLALLVVAVGAIIILGRREIHRVQAAGESGGVVIHGRLGPKPEAS
jgi:hypothetical protein